MCKIIVNEALKNIVGLRLKKLRVQRDVSQKELSDMLNSYGLSLTPSTLSKIERQKRGVSDIELLAFSKALGVEFSDIFEGCILK